MAWGFIGGRLDTSVTIYSVKAKDRNGEKALTKAGNWGYSGKVADGSCDVWVEYTRGGNILEKHKIKTVKAFSVTIENFLNLP